MTNNNRILLAALVALPMAVHGAVIVNTVSFGPATVPFGPTAVNLPQFSLNPALLTKVTLELNATLKADITAENNTASSVTATAWIIGNANAVGPSGLNPVASFAGIVAGPFPLGPTDGVAGSGPDFSSFGGTLSATQSSSDATVNPVDFGPFLGFGTFPVNVAGNGGWAVFGVSDSRVTVSNFAGLGTVKITYEYVPEPHQFAMLGALGLVGFAFWRRLKR